MLKLSGFEHGRTRRAGLELFCANQIRAARNRSVRNGGEEMEFLQLSRLRKFMRKVMDEKRDGGAVATMRGISKRVDPEPRNERKMKRRRTAATYTNFMVRWSGCQRVRFLRDAEEVCERSLKKGKENKE